MPNNERIEITASSHTAPWENPGAYDQALVAFMAKHWLVAATQRLITERCDLEPEPPKLEPVETTPKKSAKVF